MYYYIQHNENLFCILSSKRVDVARKIVIGRCQIIVTEIFRTIVFLILLRVLGVYLKYVTTPFVFLRNEIHSYFPMQFDTMLLR